MNINQDIKKKIYVYLQIVENILLYGPDAEKRTANEYLEGYDENIIFDEFMTICGEEVHYRVPGLSIYLKPSDLDLELDYFINRYHTFFIDLVLQDENKKNEFIERLFPTNEHKALEIYADYLAFNLNF